MCKLLRILLAASVFGTIVSGSPAPKPKVKTVSINCNNIKEIRIDDEKVKSVSIGITEPTYDALFHDDKIILRFRNSITAFDLASGDSLFSFSRKGRRDDEFTSIRDAWLVGDVLELYDFDSAKILQFDVRTGSFLNVVKNNEFIRGRFSSMERDSKNHRFIVEKTYNPADNNSALAEYDDSHHFVRNIKSPSKKSGFFLSSSSIILSETGRILYHEPFKSVIYEVNGLNLVPEYSIDFGNRNLPKSFAEGEGGKAMKFWMENQDKYAVVMNVIESKDALYIDYVFSKVGFLAKFDRSEGTAQVYKFAPFGGRFAYNAGTVFVISHENNGTTIYKIPESDLR